MVSEIVATLATVGLAATAASGEYTARLEPATLGTPGAVATNGVGVTEEARTIWRFDAARSGGFRLTRLPEEILMPDVMNTAHELFKGKLGVGARNRVLLRARVSQKIA